MKRRVEITTTLICVSDGQTETIRRHYSGTWAVRGRLNLLRYADAEEGAASLLSGDDGAEVRRSGAVDSRLVFRTGASSRSAYVTPHGTLPLVVSTHRYGHGTDSSSGWWEAAYIVSFGQVRVSDNTLRVVWQVTDSSVPDTP